MRTTRESVHSATDFGPEREWKRGDGCAEYSNKAVHGNIGKSADEIIERTS